MNPVELEQFLAEHFPSIGDWAKVEELDKKRVRIRLPYKDEYLRPGGTMSGPTLMALADTAMYFLLLANVGLTIHAVTTSLHITFLRRPAPGDLIAEATLLKLGKKLAVGDVRIYSAGSDDPVAQATASYSVPSEVTR